MITAIPIGGSGLGTLLFFCAAFWTGNEDLSFALRHIQNRAASFAFEVDCGFTVNPLLIKTVSYTHLTLPTILRV